MPSRNKRTKRWIERLPLDLLNINDSGSDPSSNGEIRNNAGDVKIQSGGIVQSLSNIVDEDEAVQKTLPVGGNSITTSDSPYDASDGEVILVDTSGGNVTVNTPATGQSVSFLVAITTDDTNTVTVDAGSDTILSISSTLSDPTQGQPFMFYWDHSLNEWIYLGGAATI